MLDHCLTSWVADYQLSTVRTTDLVQIEYWSTIMYKFTFLFASTGRIYKVSLLRLSCCSLSRFFADHQLLDGLVASTVLIVSHGRTFP
jgi:hypothetical protein